MGIFGLFKKKPILRYPDMEDLEKYYYKLHSGTYNELIATNCGQAPYLMTAIGSELVEYAHLDLMNLNKLLSGCNLDEIDDKQFDFVIERCSYYIAETRLLLVEEYGEPLAYPTINQMIATAAFSMADYLKGRKRYETAFPVFTREIERILSAYSDICDLQRMYDFFCHRCLSAVDKLDDYVISKFQLHPIVVVSSMTFQHLLLPLIRSHVDSGPEAKRARIDFFIDALFDGNILAAFSSLEHLIDRKDALLNKRVDSLVTSLIDGDCVNAKCILRSIFYIPLSSKEADQLVTTVIDAVMDGNRHLAIEGFESLISNCCT